MVLGAGICAAVFWRLPDGSQPIDMASVLGLMSLTWLIYILDRLLDLKFEMPDQLTARHVFHEKYAFNLSVLVVVLSCISVVLAFFVPVTVFKNALFMAVLLVFYFFMLNNVLAGKTLQWIKEPITALVFLFSVALVPLFEHTAIHLSTWVLFFQFGLIVFQNIFMFSYFELRQFPTKVNLFSTIRPEVGLRIIRIFGVLNLLTYLFLFFGQANYANLVSLTFTLMSMVLHFLSYQQAFALKNDNYRWIGDGVFLFPLWLFWF